MEEPTVESAPIYRGRGAPRKYIPTDTEFDVNIKQEKHRACMYKHIELNKEHILEYQREYQRKYREKKRDQINAQNTLTRHENMTNPEYAALSKKRKRDHYDKNKEEINKKTVERNRIKRATPEYKEAQSIKKVNMSEEQKEAQLGKKRKYANDYNMRQRLKKQL